MIPDMGLFPGYHFSESVNSRNEPIRTHFELTFESLSRPQSNHSDSPVKFIPYGQLPPVPDSSFQILEKSLSNPRLVRMSLNSIPVTQSLLHSSGLVLTCAVQPLGDLPSSDSKIERLPYELYRCVNCFGYINPNFVFFNNDQKLMCNLCESIQKAPAQVFTKETVETSTATYEFKAGPEYSPGPGNKQVFVAVVERSKESLALGVFQQVLTSLASLVDYLRPESFLAVVCYDCEGISLFRMGSCGLVEVRYPVSQEAFNTENWEQFAFSLASRSEDLKEMLQRLLEVHEKTERHSGSLSFGHVVSTVQQFLKPNGGRALFFTSTFGTRGSLKLIQSTGVKAIHDIQDKVYAPDPQYSTLAALCSESDLTVDIFACTESVLNIPSLSELCNRTGGDFWYFPGYSSLKDGERLHYYLARVLTRQQVSQVKLRVRSSFGISVDSFIGKFHKRSPLEVQIATLDSDKSICVKFRYDSTLTEEKDYFIQIAMIYTNPSSERIVRVFNTKVYTTQNFYNIFQNADIDAIVSSRMKIAASAISTLSLNQIRAEVQADLVKLMKRAREVGTDNNYSRILLPDSLKLLPLYMNSMCKLPAFTIGVASLESRAYSLSAVLSMTVLQSRLLLYPKVYEMDLQRLSVNPKHLIPCSTSSLKQDSVYLVNNGDVVLVFVGDSVAQDCFLRFFQMSEAEDIKATSENEFHTFLQTVDQVAKMNPSWHHSLYFHFQGTSNDYMIKRLMVEDQLGPEVSYSDYLKRLQKTLINLMACE